ncbi:MAG: hypothetical protein J7K68_01020 [Candidatus Diapherotrites archaeon]|nr:hypothetical protein [Candidatus Diapherotrites archaeon]
MDTKIIAVAVLVVVVVLAAYVALQQSPTQETEGVSLSELENIESSLNVTTEELEDFPEENLVPEGF